MHRAGQWAEGDFFVSGTVGSWSLELCSKMPLFPTQLAPLTSKLHMD